jgi:hypothetical protein
MTTSSRAPNTVSRFALIPLEPYDPAPPNALAVGDMAACTEPILGSKGRQDAIDLLNFTRDSVGELQQLAGGLAEQKQEYAYRVISDLCDGVAKMTQRLNAYTQREARRQRQARANARKALLDSLPDPDAAQDPRQHGAKPEPNLGPDLRASNPEEEGYYEGDESDDTPMPDHAAELPADRPEPVDLEPQTGPKVLQGTDKGLTQATQF